MSQFKLYAIGFAKEKALLGSPFLTVVLHEVMPNMGNTNTEQLETKDSSGNIVKHSVTSGAEVTAMWLSSSNRVTPPTVYAGETIKVYKYGETDKYYWKTFTYEKDIRGKETVVYAVSNLDREKDFGKHFDLDSSYSLTLDTVNKLVRLKTAKNDKEPVGYEISIDTKAGTFLLENTNGFSFSLTKDGVFTTNANKVIVNSKETTINATKLTMNAKNTIIKGGELSIESNTTFKGTTDYKAKVTFNGNATTIVENGPKPHIHLLK